MGNYEEARVKLTNNQFKILDFGAKNKTGKTLRIPKKNFQEEELPYELLLTIRQNKNKIRNTFTKNMFTDIKPSQAQLSKIIQSGKFLASFCFSIDESCCSFGLTVFDTISTYGIGFRNRWCCAKKNTWKRSCKSRKKNRFSYFE